MQGQSGEDILGSKKMNYQFLLLVRDKKYAQALILGRKILSISPDNPSVEKFCKFIEKNNSEIMQMVQREKQEEGYEYESGNDDSDEEGEQAGEQGEQLQEKQQQQEESGDESSQGSKQEDDQMQQQEQAEQEEKPKQQKIQLTTCTLNSIPHICPRHHRQQILLQNQKQNNSK